MKTVTSILLSFSAKTQSKFAQRRAQSNSKLREDSNNTEVAQPVKFIVGNIVERKQNQHGEIETRECVDSSSGFPQPQRINQNVSISIIWKFAERSNQKSSR